jgi:hypothetical protein
VQWDGGAPNAHTGSLLRNIGETLGVFGELDLVPAKGLVKLSYKSSVRVKDLFALEDTVATLTSPLWPETILPPIDRTRADRGRLVYERTCIGCHRILAGAERTNPNRKIKANMIPLHEIGTDPLTATNFAKRTVKTGLLKGSKAVAFLGKPLAEEIPALDLLKNAVIGVMIKNWAKSPLNEIKAAAVKGSLDPPNVLAYKARPLNGIWATAPYLHNGSVPTLYDMVQRPEDRPKTFHVGSREFDPVKVGYDTREGPGTSLLDTSLPGNSNVGHPFSADLDHESRLDLVEFLKTL